MATPSYALRSNGVFSATERAPVKPPPWERHFPAQTRHFLPLGSGAIEEEDTPPITTSSTRSKASDARATAASSPPAMPRRS
jgi:hypothetical protein